MKEYKFEMLEDGHNFPSATVHARDYDDGVREIIHYAMIYGQDGPVTVFEVVAGKRAPLIPASTTDKD